MANPLLLALFVAGVFLFIAFYFVSSLLYKNRHKQKYRFFNTFPYEFNYPSVFKDNVYGNLLFVSACLAVVSFYILNPIDSIYKTMSIATAIIMTAITICLVFIPLYYLRTHMVLSVIEMVLPIALTMFNFFMAFNKYKIDAFEIEKALSLISMILSGVFAFSNILLVLNPKLSFKIYYEKSENDQIKRPNVIHLAMTEWLAIFTYFASPLAVVLLVII